MVLDKRKDGGSMEKSDESLAKSKLFTISIPNNSISNLLLQNLELRLLREEISVAQILTPKLWMSGRVNYSGTKPIVVWAKTNYDDVEELDETK